MYSYSRTWGLRSILKRQQLSWRDVQYVRVWDVYAAGPRRTAADGRVPQEAHRVRRGPRAGHRAHLSYSTILTRTYLWLIWVSYQSLLSPSRLTRTPNLTFSICSHCPPARFTVRISVVTLQFHLQLHFKLHYLRLPVLVTSKCTRTRTSGAISLSSPVVICAFLRFLWFLTLITHPKIMRCIWKTMNK